MNHSDNLTLLLVQTDKIFNTLKYKRVKQTALLSSSLSAPYKNIKCVSLLQYPASTAHWWRQRSHKWRACTSLISYVNSSSFSCFMQTHCVRQQWLYCIMLCCWKWQLTRCLIAVVMCRVWQLICTNVRVIAKQCSTCFTSATNRTDTSVIRNTQH